MLLNYVASPPAQQKASLLLVSKFPAVFSGLSEFDLDLNLLNPNIYKCLQMI